MRHQDLVQNHLLESWTYANAAARTGATGFSLGDVGRIAYQTDTGQYWRLINSAPVWQIIAPPIAPVYASLQTVAANPTGSTSAAGTMAGLGTVTWGTAVITPVTSGKIFVTIAGTLSNSGAQAAQTAIRYGTGAAPINGATGTAGTQIGPVATRSNIGAALSVPFALSAVITGLALNTQIWLDLIVVAVAGVGTATVSFTSVAAYELP